MYVLLYRNQCAEGGRRQCRLSFHPGLMPVDAILTQKRCNVGDIAQERICTMDIDLAGQYQHNRLSVRVRRLALQAEFTFKGVLVPKHKCLQLLS